MAQRGRPLPASEVQRIKRLSKYLSERRTAKAIGVARGTVRKYKGKPAE